MYKACIFDLDGTLANTLESIAYFCNTALASQGIEAIESKMFRIFVGNGRDMLIRRILRYRGFEESGELFEKVGKVYDELYERYPNYLVTFYDGTDSLIDELHSRGLKLAILSNKPDDMTKAVATGLYGEDKFEIIQGQKAGVPHKPDPTAVLDIMARMGVKPEETLYIGDSGVDMETGSNAGLATAGVTWGFRDETELISNGAVYIAHNSGELRNIILK